MPQYNFVSPGAGGFNALEDFLMQRAMAERQRQEDEFKRRQAERVAQQQEAQLAFQKQQEARIADAQRQALADAEYNKRGTRAATIAKTAVPGVLGGDIGGLLSEFGYNPEAIATQGGTDYQSARMSAQERAAQAQAAQAAAAERAKESDAMRMSIAEMGNQGRAETNALRNDFLRAQTEAVNQRNADAQKKAEEKDAAAKRAKDAARVTSGATIEVLKQLADFDEATGQATLKPGTKNLYGLRNPLAQLVPGSDTANARAAMDRLSGRVIVDLLNEMKNQSATGATGFGALSGPELKLLEGASTQLTNSNIGDERAAEELSRIYKMAKQLYGEDTPTTGGKLTAKQLIEKYRR